MISAAGMGGLGTASHSRKSITLGSINMEGDSRGDNHGRRMSNAQHRPSTFGLAAASRKSRKSAFHAPPGSSLGLLDEDRGYGDEGVFSPAKTLQTPVRQNVQDIRRHSTMQSPWSSPKQALSGAALLGDLVKLTLQMLGTHEVKLAASFLQELSHQPVASLALGITLPDIGQLIHRCASLQREEQPGSGMEWLLQLNRMTSGAPMPKAPNTMPVLLSVDPQPPVRSASAKPLTSKAKEFKKSFTIDAALHEAGSNMNGKATADTRTQCESVSVTPMTLEDHQGLSILPASSTRKMSKESGRSRNLDVAVINESSSVEPSEVGDLESRAQSRRASGASAQTTATAPPPPGYVSESTQVRGASIHSEEALKPSDTSDLAIQENPRMNPGREVPISLQRLGSNKSVELHQPPGTVSTDLSTDSQSIQEISGTVQGQEPVTPIASLSVPQFINTQSNGMKKGSTRFTLISHAGDQRHSRISSASRLSTFSKAAELPGRVSEKIKQIFHHATQRNWRDSISERLHAINLSNELMETHGLDENWLAEPSHQFILNPSSTVRMTWDIMSLVVILFESMAVPFALCFDLETPEALLTFMTVFFAIDILLNFLTGFYRTGVLVMKQVAIVQNYLRTWFLLDILSTFPWGVVFSGSSSTTMLKVWKFGKMFRLIRLLRVAKLNMLIKRIEEMFNDGVMVVLISFTRILAIFLLIVHWCACFWGWLGHPDRSDKKRGPYDREYCEPGGPCEAGIEGSPWRRRYGLDEETIAHQYVMSLRFSAGVFTGSDMGIQPGFWAEHIYAIIIMMVSFVVCSTIISQIVVVFHKIQKEDSEQNDLIQAFKEFMSKRQVPFQLQQKVKRYLEYQHASRKEISAKRFELMDRLSPWLHKELEMHLNKGVLVQHEFFKKMPHEILAHTCTMCNMALAAPGDIILQRGQTAKIMCFLVRGKLHIRMSGNSLIFDIDEAEDSNTPSGSCKASTMIPTGSESANSSNGFVGNGSSIAPMSPSWSTQPMPTPEREPAADPQGFTIQAPGYIGAASLFMDEVRSYTVIAISHCELLTLTRNDVEWIAEEFPSARPYIERYISQAESQEGGFQDISVRVGSEEETLLQRLS